jgi:hypothetical protein
VDEHSAKRNAPAIRGYSGHRAGDCTHSFAYSEPPHPRSPFSG